MRISQTYVWIGVFLSNNRTTLMWHHDFELEIPTLSEGLVDDAYVCYTTLQADDEDSWMHACIVYALKL